jgi:7,8-dihydropterin-6-yl-methyl-4-(beta-D-ribofuranosyl)aminobenzene 5'-phosphate synthase
MDIKVLFNSGSIVEDCQVGWGLSFLVDGHLLFDTGEKGNLLMNNLRSLKVDVSAIDTVVISHDHWDHTGGLMDFLRKRPDVRVYLCPGFSDSLKKNVRSHKCAMMESCQVRGVAPGVFTTGEIIGTYRNQDISEQALVVKTENGLSVITGCAHPGILTIIDVVRKNFPQDPLYAVLGGFHLMNKQPRNIDTLVARFKCLGIRKAGPTHCSGSEAEDLFKNEFQDNFLSLKVGQSIDI